LVDAGNFGDQYAKRQDAAAREPLRGRMVTWPGTVNPDAVAQCERLVRAGQYVLDRTSA
jgi:hypothetical protein